MGFIGILLVFLPILAAIIGIIIALFAFMGACLMTIGITGVIMNKLYIRQAASSGKVSSTLNNGVSIILGIAFMLFPLGYMLRGVIAALFK